MRSWQKLSLVLVPAMVAGCDTSRSSKAGNEIIVLEESRLAYRVVSIVREVSGAEAEPLKFWAITEILTRDDGFVVTEPLTQRILFFDWNLNLKREVGREGRGPGEYLSPNFLANAGDGIAVLDRNLRRVSHLTPNGDFVSSSPVMSRTSDMDYHPDLGLLFASNVSPGHYLSYGPEATTPFAPIPSVLRTVADDIFPDRVDLLAVAPDGSIHVWDGYSLALASYTPEGALTRIAYLPEESRSTHLRVRDNITEGLGGPGRVTGSPVALRLQALSDGRIFVSLPMLYEDPDPIGYVIDPGSIEAIPVLLKRSDFQMVVRPKFAFHGDRLLMVEWRRTGLVIAELDSVPSER